MSAPPIQYTRTFNFNTFSTNNPLTPLPGLQVDGELNGVLGSIASVISRLAEVQRPDGAIANLSVGPDQVTPELLLLLGNVNARGDWLTGTAYAYKDLIRSGGLTYIALVAHTSGVFATDLAAGKWMVLTLETSAAFSLRGNNTAGVGPTMDLTPAQVTALLPTMAGDTGIGGVKGLAPAPAAGDAALKKFLAASGGYEVVPAADVAMMRDGTSATVFATPASVATIWRKGAAIASAATLVKPADVDMGGYHHLTGSLAVLALWDEGPDAPPVELVCDGSPLFTHDPAALILPNGINLLGVPGAVLRFRSEGAGVWRCVYSTVSSASVPSGTDVIVNGDMSIAQWGSSLAYTTGNVYLIDCWSVSSNTSAVSTITQNSDAPPDNRFQNSLRVAVTTADAAIAINEQFHIRQPVEGYNVRNLVGKPLALSFSVRSSKTGVHCAALRNGAADRSYIMEYTINTANTWEEKTCLIPAGLITAGTWDYASGIGLYVAFSLATGANFQAAPNAWQTGNFLATANQVNCLDAIGNIFAITGVQLEQSPVATPYKYRSFMEKLLSCMRFYEQTFPYGTTPASNIGGAIVGAISYTAMLAGVNRHGAYWNYKAPKRINAPVITTFNPSFAATTWCNTTGVDTASGAVTVSEVSGRDSAYLLNAGIAGDAVNNTICIHAVSDARL